MKEQYLPDVAIQLHVRAPGRARRAARRGDAPQLAPAAIPDLSDLFVREDVTEQAEALLPDIPGQREAHAEGARRQAAGRRGRAALRRPLRVPVQGALLGAGPGRPRLDPLLRPQARRERLLDEGIESIRDIPDGTALSAVQARQVRRREGRRGGRRAPAWRRRCAALKAPVAYLDFETISPAIPVWKGCGPYMAVPVQLSCHVVGARGATTHHEHLAEGPEIRARPWPRRWSAPAQGAETVVAYNAPFERKLPASTSPSTFRPSARP